MCDGQFGLIEAIEHKIEMEKNNNRPIHSGTYREEPQAREFEKQEINLVLAMDAIEPRKTEWASSIVFVTSKTEIFAFV